MKRDHRRKIRLRKNKSWDEYQISFPKLDDAVLRQVMFNTRIESTVPERQALLLSAAKDGGLYVAAEVGPDDPFRRLRKEDPGEFWTRYGRMPYYQLPALVKNVSYGLARALLKQSSTLTSDFHPEGRWRWVAPVTIKPHKPEAYWHRACVTLAPNELQPLSFEEMIHSYINGSFFSQPVKDTDVLLTYRAPDDEFS